MVWNDLCEDGPSHEGDAFDGEKTETATPREAKTLHLSSSLQQVRDASGVRHPVVVTLVVTFQNQERRVAAAAIH